MLNEYQIVAAVAARLTTTFEAAYPLYQKAWAVPFPAKPETITGEMIRVQHTKGLYSVRYMESEGAGNSENMLIGVYIWATSTDMESKLARAAKMIFNNYSPGGTTPLQLHKDEPVIQENGVMVRVVTFRCQTSTIRTHNPVTDIAGLNL